MGKLNNEDVRERERQWLRIKRKLCFVIVIKITTFEF